MMRFKSTCGLFEKNVVDLEHGIEFVEKSAQRANQSLIFLANSYVDGRLVEDDSCQLEFRVDFTPNEITVWMDMFRAV